jgi:secreted trypsin-like serine protease
MAFIIHRDALGNFAFCSGTVVSTNVVLTAGHCAVDESTGATLDPSGFTVVTGAVDWTDTVDRHASEVSQVIVDPAYNRAAKTSDAALLVLSTPTTAPTIRLAGSADRPMRVARCGSDPSTFLTGARAPSSRLKCLLASHGHRRCRMRPGASQ